jgi:hypothetical protein
MTSSATPADESAEHPRDVHGVGMQGGDDLFLAPGVRFAEVDLVTVDAHGMSCDKRGSIGAEPNNGFRDSHSLPRGAQQRSLPVTQHQACPQDQAAAVRWPAGGLQGCRNAAT